MKLLLEMPEVREAIRQYVTSKGYILAIPKTVNQNTGLLFQWKANDPSGHKLSVKVSLKEER